MLRILFIALFTFGLSSAFAGMKLEQMQEASGLATVISSAEPCGYSINQNQLAEYYVSKKLATPEILSFIDSNVTVASMGGDKPTASQCTIARVTGIALGIVKE